MTVRKFLGVVIMMVISIIAVAAFTSSDKGQRMLAHDAIQRACVSNAKIVVREYLACDSKQDVRPTAADLTSYFRRYKIQLQQVEGRSPKFYDAISEDGAVDSIIHVNPGDFVIWDGGREIFWIDWERKPRTSFGQ